MFGQRSSVAPERSFGAGRRRVARAGTLLALTAAAVMVAEGTRAAELVMFETVGCVWCAAWNREVGGIYHTTEEGRLAPLRRVELHGPRPHDLRDIEGIVYTPTFVLTDDGREVGRIDGYPGNEHFWGLLGVLVKKLRPPPES